MTYELKYHYIRMAVFDPQYLIDHPKHDEEDFTNLIDEIVKLQLMKEEWKSLKLELAKYKIESNLTINEIEEAKELLAEHFFNNFVEFVGKSIKSAVDEKDEK